MFVVARTAAKRPTLMHAIHPQRSGHTLCGLDFGGWSRAYLNEVIPEILCSRCSDTILRQNKGRRLPQRRSRNTDPNLLYPPLRRIK